MWETSLNLWDNYTSAEKGNLYRPIGSVLDPPMPLSKWKQTFKFLTKEREPAWLFLRHNLLITYWCLHWLPHQQKIQSQTNMADFFTILHDISHFYLLWESCPLRFSQCFHHKITFCTISKIALNPTKKKRTVSA